MLTNVNLIMTLTNLEQNDEITKWYIIGCQLAQIDLNDTNKEFLISCIETLKIMVEN